MAAMNEFLQRLDEPELRESYAELDALWDARAAELNERLEKRGLPVRFANLTSVWTTLYTRPVALQLDVPVLPARRGPHALVGRQRPVHLQPRLLGTTTSARSPSRIERAAEKMAADGWWWWDGTTTDAAIDRQHPQARSADPSSGSMSSPRTTR